MEGEAAAVDVEPTVIEVSIHIDARPERCFTTASSTEGLARIFPGSGAVPGVASARMEDDKPQLPGNTRLVTLLDGSEVPEKKDFFFLF